MSLDLDAQGAAFASAVAEAGLQFSMPDGFAPALVRPNPHVACDHAILSRDPLLEVRYKILPPSFFVPAAPPGVVVTGRAIDSVVLFQSFFLSTFMNASGSTAPRIDPFPPDAVRNEFGADWGANGAFHPVPELGGSYAFCLMVGVHARGGGGAMMFYFYDGFPDAVRDTMTRVFSCLRFRAG